MRFHIIPWLFFTLIGSLKSHPIPDIPVIGNFEHNGSCKIIVEIDTRCFAEDPEDVPFLSQSVFESYSKEKKDELILQAINMLKNSLEIRFGDQTWFTPDFKFEFDSKTQEEEENLIAIKGTYSKQLDSDSTFYQIKSKASTPYDLVFTNIINGKPQRRVNVLFPSEESFKLELNFIQESIEEKVVLKEPVSLKEKSQEEKTADARSTFFSFGRQGFVHVLPLGLDHILFVLGLFFLSRQWKPIIYQISVFTVAHTITLGLATLDLISASPSVVEPIIAASIAVVAIENILFPGYRHLRLIIVFFFGLIHGLGFAGALSAFNLDPTSLIIGLLGFNIGVEFGQLAVIAIVLGLTFWIKNKETYRKWIVIPGSSLIALFGIYWTIERTLL
tara:strand:+ start:19914 stop:21080 length:1167 start_codon:yes stop_codon:yes gene_type:complete